MTLINSSISPVLPSLSPPVVEIRQEYLSQLPYNEDSEALDLSQISKIQIVRSGLEVENSLKPLLNKLKIDKKNLLYSKQFIYLTADVFGKMARKHPVVTLLKCAAIGLALICLHPTIVGSIACLRAYYIENYTDLYSSGKNIKTNASILFSNSGQGISFLVQEVELAVIPAFLLFKNVYNQAKCEAIKKMYNLYISSLVNEKEKAFLFEEANYELSKLGDYLAENEEINTVMKTIEKEKERHLSPWNILRLTADKFCLNIKKHPALTLAKTTLLGLTTLSLHPLTIGLIGFLDSYQVDNPSNLFSDNITIETNAINVFSNTGHVVEYSVCGLVLLAISASVLFEPSVSLFR